MLKAMVCGSKVRLCWLTFCRNSVVGICVLFECLTVGCVCLVAWLFVESLIVTISWWRSEGVSKFARILKTGSAFLVGVGAVSVCLIFTVDGVSRGKLCCLTCFSRFILVNPANLFHFDLVVSYFVLIVSKNSSWLTWNCGDILPVVRFRTKDTVRACLCELPAAQVTVVALQYTVAAVFSSIMVKHPYLNRTFFCPPVVVILIISPLPLPQPNFLARIFSWLCSRWMFLEVPSNRNLSGSTARL